MPSTLKTAGFRKWFKDDPLLPVLLAMVRYGADARYCGPKRDRLAHNHPSMIQASLDKYISEAQGFNAVRGPSPNIAAVRAELEAQAGSGVAVHIAPKGTVPKAGSVGRLIDDKSCGGPISVNFHVDMSTAEKVQMDRLNVVTHLIQAGRRKYGPHATLKVSKIDIKAAYRRVLLRVLDWWLGGISSKDSKGNIQYWIECALSFGLASAVWWFCIIAAAIRNASKGAELDLFLAQYLDDSLIISEASRAQDDVDRLRGLIVDLGFSVNKKKLAAEGTPADSVVYIGIEVDVHFIDIYTGMLLNFYL